MVIKLINISQLPDAFVGQNISFYGNMMHIIATGEYNAEQAKEKYAEKTAAYVVNRPAPFAERLQFKLPRELTGDYDKTTIGDKMINQVKEKAKDLLGFND